MRRASALLRCQTHLLPFCQRVHTSNLATVVSEAEPIDPVLPLPNAEKKPMKLKKMLAVLHGLSPEHKKSRKRKHILEHVSDIVCVTQANRNIIDELFAAMVDAPISTQYRTKCRFSFGFDAQKRPVLGVESQKLMADASSLVFCIDDCVTVTHLPETLEIAKCIEDFLTSEKRSGFLGRFPPYSPVSTNGFYRSVVIRSYASGIMVTLSVNAKNRPEEKKDQIKRLLSDVLYKRLVENFCPTTSEISGIKRTCSLFYEEIKGPFVNQRSQYLELLAGPPHVTVELSSPFDDINYCLKFRLSPNVFFSIHLSATEKMYRAIVSLCGFLNPERTVLLDICCGVGTIGQLFAPKVRRVIGIDSDEMAIKDARFNAQENSALTGDKCEYFHGNVTDVLPRLVNNGALKTPEGHKTDLVAILDPDPRGLGSQAIDQLRRIPALKRLVYVSCDEQAARNYDKLCSNSANLAGKPFQLKKIIPVDTFPLTLNYELLLLFERD